MNIEQEETLTQQVNSGKSHTDIIKQVIPIGTILETSWGYDMTINNYCIVKENTGKTLKCVMLTLQNYNDDGMGGGTSKPTKKEYGKPFRLKVSLEKWKGINDNGRYHLSMRGTYPFVDSKSIGNTRLGHFRIWDGNPDYYNTWD